jgi:RimJ/RimL family protein N-acetyltransferase
MSAPVDDRPVGPKVDPLPAGTKPDGRPLYGRYVLLDHVSALKHHRDLYGSFAASDPDGELWTYMGYGPFADLEQFRAWLEQREASVDPLFYAFIPKASQAAAGMGSFMRHDAANGVIEIGHIWLSPGVQRTREATEGIYLMMRHAFEDLGVRRLEWKCDALNAASRRAALRLGFTFEGIFRQATIYKGRNRDTAWFSIVDREWPALRAAFERWLDPASFDDAGRQRASLAALTRAAEAPGISARAANGRST